MTSSGERRHQVTLQNPSAPAADGDGGYTSAWADLSPAKVFARIEPATTSRLERVTGATVESAATHIVTFPYHADVTTKTRIVFGTRVLQVTGVSNPEERGIETIAVCTEIVA